MKQRLLWCFVALLAFWPLVSVQAQSPGPSPSPSPTPSSDPFYRDTDEGYLDLASPAPDPDPKNQAQYDWNSQLGSMDSALSLVQQSYGIQDANPTPQDSPSPSPTSDTTTNSTQAASPQQTNKFVGALDVLKIKPSDKKRLIEIANGSLSDKQKQSILYDSRLLDLLTLLATPKELGGAGFTHLRVSDLLRFRHDPRSHETESADNISAHTQGRAADITEINTTHCVKQTAGLFGVGASSQNLPEFPVKVAWQGGAPLNPTPEELAAFDSVARANAVRDILGTIPSTTGTDSFRGLTDLLQQVQRRVIADDLGLPRDSLDYLTNNDLLVTLGQASLNQGLGLSPYALQGANPQERVRSIARAPLEEAFGLPPTSLAGDNWNQSLERLGRYLMAQYAGVDPQKVLSGQTGDLGNSPYLKDYKRAEAAFDVPAGSLAGAQSNQASAFRAIGGQKLARILHLAPDEVTSFVQQAQSGSVNQLNLGRYGALPTYPNNDVLAVIAPATNSSKKAGETFVGQQISDAPNKKTSTTFDSDILDTLGTQFSTLSSSPQRDQIIQALLNNKDNSTLDRRIGALQMEKVFDLPPGSLLQALTLSNTPTVPQYEAIIGPTILADDLQTTFSQDELKDYSASQQQLLRQQTLQYYFDHKQYGDIVDKRLHLISGTTSQFYQGQLSLSAYQNKVGVAYMNNDFQDTFHDFYHTSGNGLASLSLDDEFSLLLGKGGDIATRAGASWVEEDLGLAPDSFAVLFAPASPDERLTNAGVTVLAGNLWQAFEIDATNINSLSTLEQRVGQARIETLLGLQPGSFHGSVKQIKDANLHWNAIFASPPTVDTILGVPTGTVASFLGGGTSADQLIMSVGQKLVQNIDVATLHTKFGWDDRFKLIDQQQGSGTGQGQTNQVVPLTSFDGQALRQLLAKIGGYNTDFAFGYDPHTIDQWIHAGSLVQQNQILADMGAKLYADRIGIPHNDRTSLLNSYKIGDQQDQQTAMADYKKSTGIPNDADVASLVQGDIPRSVASAVAANAAKNNKVPNLPDPYGVYHILYNHWGDANLEQTMSQSASTRYDHVLQDFAITKSGSLLDHVLTAITQGVLKPDGTFDSSASPYGDPAQVKHDYFGNKEARSDFLYGSIDAAIRTKDSTLPNDFSKDLFDGGNIDRSQMIYTFLNTKVGDGILNSLPTDLQSTVASWLSNHDAISGQSLASNATFDSWASTVIGNYTDTTIAPDAMGLAAEYFSGLPISSTTIDISAFSGLEPTDMTGFIDKQMGLDAGTFGAVFTQTQDVQTMFGDYQSGNLDEAQALFAVDSALLDGQIAQFTSTLDSTLGLPPGSSQLLLEYGLTQNPVYLGQLAYNIFFGSTIVCPDLQKEAQKNIKQLLSSILDLGVGSARLIPSQIITLSPDYTKDIMDKVNYNYWPCYLDNSQTRCGVLANPDYVKQVHIGF